MDRAKHRKKPKVVSRSHSSTSIKWTEYTPLVEVRFVIIIKDNPLTFTPLVQAGQSQEAPTLRDQENPSFFHILKFIKQEWYMVLIGVFLYGVIGVAYPIYGAVIAHVTIVSLFMNVFLCMITLQYIFQGFSESNKDEFVRGSRDGSLGLIFMAFAAGLFYFLGVK